MDTNLLSEIEEFLAEARIGDHRFGILACSNGRLVERLREGRPVLTTTEAKVRAFINERRAAREAAQ